MTKRDLAYFKHLLEDKRAAILQDLGTLQSPVHESHRSSIVGRSDVFGSHARFGQRDDGTRKGVFIRVARRGLSRAD